MHSTAYDLTSNFLTSGTAYNVCQVKCGGPLTGAGLPALLGMTIASRRGQPLIGIFGDPPGVYPQPRVLIGIVSRIAHSPREF